MEDFNSYAKNSNQEKPKLEPNLTNLISSLASKYNGASEAELMQAIFNEAEKGRKNGTLSDADIDNFARMLAPMLDEKKRQKLNLVVGKLKKI